MAIDWIKMRTDMYRDPKVCVISDLLMSEGSALSDYVNQNMQCDMTVTRNVMRNMTVGALVAVWGIARHRGKRHEDDLIIHNTPIEVVDDIADIPGFGDAMISVGWIVEQKTNLVFPNFFVDFNVDPEDERKKKDAERQKRFREKHREKRNVTVTLHSNGREEKSREEENKKNPPTPQGGCARFDEFWDAWPKHERKRDKAKCKQHWTRHRLDDVADAVLVGLERDKKSHMWTKDGGQWIPMPMTWLNGRRWEDGDTANDYADEEGYDSLGRPWDVGRYNRFGIMSRAAKKELEDAGL